MDNWFLPFLDENVCKVMKTLFHPSFPFYFSCQTKQQKLGRTIYWDNVFTLTKHTLICYNLVDIILIKNLCAFQISGFLAGLFSSRLTKRVMIVAPKTLIAHWIKELSAVGLSQKIKE